MDAGKFIVAIGIIILLISVGGILISIMLILSFFGIVIVIAGLLISYLFK